jgi:ABC-2 type transport system permease protein
MGALLRSRWIAVGTTPLCVLSAAVAVVVVPLLAAAMLRAGPATLDLADAMLRAMQLGQVCCVVLAAAATGHEYEGSSLRTSLLSTPRRGRFLGAQVVVTGGAVLGSFLLVLAAGALAAALGGTPVVWWAQGGAVVVLRCLASWLGLALLAAFLAVAARSLIVPVVLLVPLLLGVSTLVQGLLPVARLLPDLATYSVFVPAAADALLAPTTGLLVLGAWVLLAAVAAAWRHTRQDVR